MVAAVRGGISQSPYFSETFDCAVFDGPLRVYFNKDHEAEGLKIYYRLQERIGVQTAQRWRTHPTLFVMVYMTTESYLSANPESDPNSHVFVNSLGEDWVMGINGQQLDARYEALCGALPEVY